MRIPGLRRLGATWALGALLAAPSCGEGGGSDGSGSPLVAWPTDAPFATALDAVVPDRLTRHLTDEVDCEWMRRMAGSAPAWCR